MCLARRYVNCRSCGGLHHRPIFVHIRSKAQVKPVPGQLSTSLAVLVWLSMASHVTACRSARPPSGSA